MIATLVLEAYIYLHCTVPSVWPRMCGRPGVTVMNCIKLLWLVCLMFLCNKIVINFIATQHNIQYHNLRGWLRFWRKIKHLKALVCSNNVTVKLRNDKLKCLTHNRTLPKSLTLLMTVHKSCHRRHISQHRYEHDDNYVLPAFIVVVYYYRNGVTYYTNVDYRAYKVCGRYTIIHPVLLARHFYYGHYSGILHCIPRGEGAGNIGSNLLVLWGHHTSILVPASSQ
jgi:hypothetical protein